MRPFATPAHLVLGLGLAVCGWLFVAATPGSADEAATDAAAEAERRLGALEATLLDAASVDVEFAVTAAGAVTADLAGSFRLDGPRLTLDVAGTFAERAMKLEIRTTEDGRLVGGFADAGDGAPRFDVELPPHLREAVALGFTRMGILHNLALLAGGRPPDHADVGIGDWLQLADFEPAAANDDAADGVRFDLTVGGEPAAEDIQLWIDAAGHPTLRHQNVAFPQGEMRVVETYSSVTITE